jgi:ribulose-phosphate 3-epimerase
MGVHPGKEHQNFISSVYRKIEKLRKMNKKVKIQIDGGVNLQTAKKLRKEGANYANTGSFVSDSDNPRDALNRLERAFRA